MQAVHQISHVLSQNVLFVCLLVCVLLFWVVFVFRLFSVVVVVVGGGGDLVRSIVSRSPSYFHE